jgi:group I intron endonuclease
MNNNNEIFSIYLIENKINKKKYVGITKQNPPRKRWSQHKSQKGPSQKQKPLHRAIQKDGKENFTFTVICQTKHKEEAIRLEKYFIQEYKTHINEHKTGYNVTLGGDGVWGLKHTEESRKKMSESARKSYLNDPELGKRKVKSLKGRKQTKESNIKRSKALKGNKPWCTGKKLTKKHREKTSKTMKERGIKPTNKAIQKSVEKCSLWWELTDPDGNKYTIKNLTKFCRENRLSHQNLWKVSKGLLKHSQKWKCRRINNNEQES